MNKEGYSVRRVPEVIAKSGSALLHFYSDAAYEMSGFNISYRLNSCLSSDAHTNCSGHGACNDGVCTCDTIYTGDACDVSICPKNCSGPENGACNREMHRCDCKGDYRGKDCSQREELGFWDVVQAKQQAFAPEGSASHGAVVWRDSLYIVGGESYERAKLVYVYDFTGNIWETVHMNVKNIPQPRYGHSAVLFGNKIYMYGGAETGGNVSAELWAFDISTKVWENIAVRAEPCNTSLPLLCGLLQSTGHTATVVSSKLEESERMIVIFGHSPIYGYLNTVQEYNFGTREWCVVETKGLPVKGGYGHSSAWDSVTQKIYVYGGYLSDSSTIGRLSNKLYSYNPYSSTWLLLMNAPSARFLHSAVVSRGLMLVYGGNTHNDSIMSYGAKCYSSDFFAYDIACDSWSSLPTPPLTHADLSRFGHSAVLFNDSIFFYGGFDGQLRSDLLQYTPGQCISFDKESCFTLKPGIKCVWDNVEERCEVAGQGVGLGADQCSEDLIYQSRAELCTMLNSCGACVQTSYQCVWCGGQAGSCRHAKCNDLDAKSVSFIEQCEVSDTALCHQLHNCQACVTNTRCRWEKNEHKCNPIAGNVTNEVSLEPTECPASCSHFSSCQECTQEECIWCQSEAQCVDKNAYLTSFPYGQCRDYITQQYKCRRTVPGQSECEVYSSCAACREDPACGWCDDGSGTGLGRCLRGGNQTPGNPDFCSADAWYFTHCPSCQCNGHSMCVNGSSECSQPCANLTQGAHCDRCVPGYHGNPLNGGRCAPCECNKQSTQCDADSGKCVCTTKGVIGDHCERCDNRNNYFQDPKNTGSCFYELETDYQYTFNLSNKRDLQYSQIKYKNTPSKPDIDADFHVVCSVPSKVNVTTLTDTGSERYLLEAQDCSTFRFCFSESEYQFGSQDNVTQTTFYVYVYDFHPPLWIQISFSQYPKLNLEP